MRTPAQARMEGFTVDSTCYPWFGYKGPRFSPTEHCHVLTDLEAELLDSTETLIIGIGMGWDMEGIVNVAKSRITQVPA